MFVGYSCSQKTKQLTNSNATNPITEVVESISKRKAEIHVHEQKYNGNCTNWYVLDVKYSNMDYKLVCSYSGGAYAINITNDSLQNILLQNEVNQLKN